MNTDPIYERFAGRKLLVATKHQKEKVIAPLLERSLGVKCFVDPKFDSDRFGTFSGEIERRHDPLTTLREKCLAAIGSNDCDLVVGSEGSFGPHPTIGLIPANEEWMMLIDQKQALEISVRTVSTETNFNGTEIKSESELLAFAERIKFPEHAMILRPGSDQTADIQKGIADRDRLIRTFHRFQEQYGSAFAETDMRALYNPTRLNVIKSLTEKLIHTLRSTCPRCQTPGFDVVEAIPGLICQQCGMRTRSTLQHRYQCRVCGKEESRNFPHGKELEDPMYCDFCNP